MQQTTALSTRAALRYIEPRTMVLCPGCDKMITWSASNRKARQVLANIYEGDTWSRLENFHAICYAKAGNPYGEPEGKNIKPRPGH